MDTTPHGHRPGTEELWSVGENVARPGGGYYRLELSRAWRSATPEMGRRVRGRAQRQGALAAVQVDVSPGKEAARTFADLTEEWLEVVGS
ncbi:MAG: hypothetical protein JWM85_3221 [Acidimicrobiaceae bacterium]|nr:hypothetical protein [Acidimicrobiaceae bacterium]